VSLAVLIPASGNATRMRGFPKFLLPNGNNDETLLESHLRAVSIIADEMLIAVNPIFLNIVQNASLNFYGATLMPMETRSMTETVINLAEDSNADRFLVLMPDTAYLGESPYSKLLEEQNDLNLSVWKIRNEQKGKLGQVQLDDSNFVLDCVDKDQNCKYEFAWGVQLFTRKYLDYLSAEQPHVGYGIMPAIRGGLKVGASLVAGTYWDCGTPNEYVNFLKSSITSK